VLVRAWCKVRLFRSDENGRTRLRSTRISQDYELSQLLASGLASLRNAEVPWMDDVGLSKSAPDNFEVRRVIGDVK
jgi:hypothetical protein